MVLTWVSVGAEATACTKHLIGLSGAPRPRCRDHLVRLLDSGFEVGVAVYQLWEGRGHRLQTGLSNRESSGSLPRAEPWTSRPGNRV